MLDLTVIKNASLNVYEQFCQQYSLFNFSFSFFFMHNATLVRNAEFILGEVLKKRLYFITLIFFKRVSFITSLSSTLDKISITEMIPNSVICDSNLYDLDIWGEPILVILIRSLLLNIFIPSL